MEEKINVILVNADDMGYGDLGCYGSTANRTPAIDWMAENGMLFTDFYAASSVCSPSRGALMTGCYPPRIGFGSFEKLAVLFPGQGVGLSAEEYTIPRMFKNAGYATMMVGKWHCGDQPEFLPTRHGFDHYFGLPYSNDMGRQAGRMEGLDRLGPVTLPLPYPPMPLINDDEVMEEQPDLSALTERYVEKSLSFIRNCKKEDKPFFLYFAHMHVHRPLYAAARFVRESKNGDYGACVEAIDWSMAALLFELNKLGLLENTMIMFTSDNGSHGYDGASNAPLRGRKGSAWEGGQRVPFVVYAPALIKENGRCDAVTSNIDLLPTLSEIIGEPLSDNKIDGRSFAHLLEKNELTEEDAERPFFYYLRKGLRAVRVGNWKMHFVNPHVEKECLFDLSNDIGETKDVYDEHPEIVARLKAYADEMRADIGDGLTKVVGNGNRPCGRVENPRPLTVYDENHPYIMAFYDRPDCG